MSAIKKLNAKLKNLLFNGEAYLMKPFLKYLLHLVLFAIFTTILFDSVPTLIEKFPLHRELLSMSLALIFPMWIYIAYLFLRNRDEMIRQMFLKGLSIAAICGATALLGSSFRQSVGHGSAIEEGILITFMAASFLVSVLYFQWKASK